MDRSVPAAEANRHFSSLLRAVSAGETVTITSHGRPVARFAPVDADLARRQASLAAHLDELERTPSIDIGPWTRDELYER